MGHFIQSLCNLCKIFLRFTRSPSHKSDRCYGNSFIDNRYSKFSGNLFTGLYQILGRFIDFMVYFLFQPFQIRIYAVQQADSQCYRPYIQIFFLNHLIRFCHFVYINHNSSHSLYSMHFVKNLFLLALDDNAYFFPQRP